MRKLTLAIAAAAVLAVPGQAQTQTQPTQGQVIAQLCKGAVPTRVRLNKLKPGVTMADFQAAVAAHKAWYKSHGYKLTMTTAPVVTMKDGKLVISSDEVMSFATGDSVPRDKQDQAWNDYVAKYRAASDLTVEQFVCMPKSGG